MIWLFAALLVVWGNVVAFLVEPELPGDDPIAVVLGVALAVVAILFARSRGLGPAELGVRARWRELGVGAIVGALVGALAALGGVLVLRFPPLLGGPVTYRPVATVSDAELLRHLFFYLPLSVVLPEELAFRGALVGALRAAHGSTWAVAGSAFAFGLWHAVTILTTVVQTNLAGIFFVLGVVGAFAVVFAGGAAFASLRLRTGTLATTIGLHWAFNAVILAGLRV